LTRFRSPGPGRMGVGMTERSGARLLGLPVRLHGLQLGQPTDLLLDRDAMRAVGIDVVCGDGAHRFLPLPTAVVGVDAITITSPLVLLEADELAFYRSRSFTLSSLRGRPVERDGATLGALRDVIVGTDGELEAVVVERDGSTDRIPFDGDLRFASERRSAA
jgi:uncharacterized protein YrrD